MLDKMTSLPQSRVVPTQPSGIPDEKRRKKKKRQICDAARNVFVLCGVQVTAEGSHWPRAEDAHKLYTAI